MADVRPRKILVKDMNDAITCTLCNGYLVDATTLTECHHVFCRGCILRYFENCKPACPSCNFVYKKKNQVFFKADPQIQSIVYKVVPGLYSKEMQRREDFYRSTGVRASSSCSDDSVLERERDRINDEDSMVVSSVGDKSQFFGPDDLISLSLEYYQVHLDTTDGQQDEQCVALNNNNSDAVSDKHKQLNGENKCKVNTDQRYLRCPAAVSMRHLQKFIRMKFALTLNHKVDIIYHGEVLPLHFSLMDVAYSFNWKRLKPMRFFYRIFTPLKIQPIKIVSTGDKQLQVVPASVKTAPDPPPPPPKLEPKEERQEEGVKEREEKERLLAHLQLQSKTKIQEVPEKTEQDCVFDYEEPDKEEIKRFAERRDREWAMQKKLDESKEKDDDYHHFSKKRKKNKHSKNDFSYKKRKLHAEITNKEEELKLKVKLTTPHNGHKHKHHKSEVSSKEKLLQMRQVRHKHVSSEDKNVQTVPSDSKETNTEIKEEKPKEIKESNGVKPEEKPPVEIKAKLEIPSKTLRSDFPSKQKDLRIPTVQIERNEQTELQAKKSFQKTYQGFAEKFQAAEKTPKVDNSAKNKNLSLERKIANLQQRCTIEKKPQPEEKPKVPYPVGFTVSKIEAGKKKIEEEKIQDKRPSLEITLINPPNPEKPHTAKRPPPPTIPLDRIKKTFNFKSGISITPKVEKCDNIGALDLSAKPSLLEAPSSSTKPVNGFASPTPPKEKVNMSNLQMLSKVAAEHPALNKPKPKPQMPNLQTLRIPSPNQRIPPSLKMIDKTQFRMMSPQIRNLRPNQNQSIRNIPNPSLLVRQQQSRLNSLNPVQSNGEKEAKAPPPVEPPPVKLPETKISEKPEVAV